MLALSVFYVLKGLIKLRKKGIFEYVFIKKRRYWPSMVPGKDTEDNLGVGVEVGETDDIQRKFDDVI